MKSTAISLVVLLAVSVTGYAQEPLPFPRDVEKRPAILLPLYVSFATTQVLDVHSTRLMLDSGLGRETNPLVPESTSLFVVIKAGVTVAVIASAEHMWKRRHRVAAVLLIAGATAAHAVAAAHNYHLAKGARSAR